MPRAIGQSTAEAGDVRFLQVSSFLTGHDQLPVALASRLYRELAADDPAFVTGVRDLLALVRERRIDPQHLQRVLERERSSLAPLPRKIMTAWYLGVVGEGMRARAVAYETALNAQAVRDVLHAPTYCYGVYGDWARNPV